MILVNINEFDLRHNTREIILEMIKCTESPYEEIILFGDNFGQVIAANTDEIIFNNNTVVIEDNNGNTFVVNHSDVAAFKVIR